VRSPRRIRAFAVAGVLALAAVGAAAARAADAPASSPPADAPPSAALLARSDSLLALETRVHWEAGPPESALARARRDSLPAYLDFYATWCAPCRWMDRVVYPDPLLAEVSEGVRMIRVDIDSPAGKALAARFDVEAYPTLVFVGREGKESLRWIGPLSLRDTRLNLAQASVPAEGRSAVEHARQARPGDALKVGNAVLFFAYRGEVENARAAVAAYEKLTAGSARPSDAAAVRLGLGKAEEFAGRDSLALDSYARVLLTDPQGMFAWRAWLGMSACLERRSERDRAAEAALKAATLGPHAPWLLARAARLALKLPRPVAPPGVDDGPPPPPR
jgi:thiol-disulfide isomerase/thioredoxin